MDMYLYLYEAKNTKGRPEIGAVRKDDESLINIPISIVGLCQGYIFFALGIDFSIDWNLQIQNIYPQTVNRYIFDWEHEDNSGKLRFKDIFVAFEMFLYHLLWINLSIKMNFLCLDPFQFICWFEET